MHEHLHTLTDVSASAEVNHTTYTVYVSCDVSSVSC